MKIRISVSVLLLLIFVLTFANIYANKNNLTPITDINLDFEYNSNEEYLYDFNQKANSSGRLFYVGVKNLLDVFPDTVGQIKKAIQKITGWISDVFGWLDGLNPEPPSSGGGGGGGFRSR